MDDLIPIIQALIGAEQIFSITFLLIVLGGGRWFTHSAWPWATEYMEKRNDQNYKLRREEIEGRRVANDQMIAIMRDLSEKLGSFQAVMDQVSSVLLLLTPMTKKDN